MWSGIWPVSVAIWASENPRRFAAHSSALVSGSPSSRSLSLGRFRMNYDYSKRGYLLPEGCKDLIDVQKIELEKALQKWRERQEQRRPQPTPFPSLPGLERLPFTVGGYRSHRCMPPPSATDAGVWQICFQYFRTVRTISSRSWRSIGLVLNELVPCRYAARMSSGKEEPLSMLTGMHEKGEARSHFTNSKPLMPGIFKSVRIK